MAKRWSIDALLAALPKVGLAQDDVLTGPPRTIFGLPVWPGPEVAVVGRDMNTGFRYTLYRDGTVTHTYPNGNTQRALGVEAQLAAVLVPYVPQNFNDGWPGHW
jgi:hypothetical protein